MAVIADEWHTEVCPTLLSTFVYIRNLLRYEVSPQNNKKKIYLAVGLRIYWETRRRELMNYDGNLPHDTIEVNRNC